MAWAPSVAASDRLWPARGTSVPLGGDGSAVWWPGGAATGVGWSSAGRGTTGVGSRGRDGFSATGVATTLADRPVAVAVDVPA